MLLNSLWYNFRWLKRFAAIIAISLLLLFSFPAYAQSQPSAKNVMVHLFEWKWTDIEAECAYLGEKGYNAIQVSPPNEHAVKASDGYPWWQRYQPVTYELDKSRSGNLDQFKSMVDTCWKNHGVKIYVDAIINHMAAGDGIGSNGTSYKGASDYTLYDKESMTYKYSSSDFHPQCGINWDGDVPAEEIRNCWVAGGGLPDLETESDWVRARVIDFLNSMIDLGVAGFRIDAAKHMNPEDITYIAANLNDLRSDEGWFSTGSRPFIFQEVIFGQGQGSGPSDYDNTVKGSNLNVTEFRYGTAVGQKFRNDNSGTISDFIKYNFPVASSGWNMLDSAFSVVFTDNHDNQRGHGSGYWTSDDDNSIGGIVTHFYDGRIYNLANVFMLAWPYGTPKVMSSYNWPRDVRCSPSSGCKDVNDGVGPPSDSSGNTNNVACFKDWVCEHRWTSIAGMVGFNNYAQDAWNVAHTWHNDRNQIAFSRVTSTGEAKAFVAINREGYDLNRSFETGLPEGRYCDVARTDYTLGSEKCDGPIIEVNSSGLANIQLSSMSASAIHIGSKLEVGSPPPPPPQEGVEVSFTCQNGHTGLGSSVYVAGNIKELGNWSVKNGSQKLDPTDYPTWTGTIKLPAKTNVEWKCVKALESSLKITQWQQNADTKSGNNEVSLGTSNLSVTSGF